MADVGFNFQQCLLFSKFHNLKISLFPRHPCMHRSKIIDYTGLKWNRIHYLIQNGRSKMVDGSSSPSFFSNNVIMTSLLLLKSIIYLLVNLIILSDTLRLRYFEYWFICTGTCSRISCTLKDNNKIVRCTKLHYSKVLPSIFKIPSTETSFYNTLNGTTGEKRRQAQSTRVCLSLHAL